MIDEVIYIIATLVMVIVVLHMLTYGPLIAHVFIYVICAIVLWYIENKLEGEG